MNTLFIATRNAHKVAEIRHILSGECQCLSQADLPGAPAVVEDEATFAGNARKKAEGLAAWLEEHPLPFLDKITAKRSSILVLADDSGLEVDALGGAPGVHSARFATDDAGGTGNAPDSANNAKLLRLLSGLPPERRTARFRCVLALAPMRSSHVTDATRFFEGSCEGRINFSPAGAGGFGYDPLFVPVGWTESLAELGESVKNTISHRAKALQKLRQFLMGGV
jgi:XTP/dITP diphosphohydrolase